MTTITIPLDVAEAAAEALGNFVSDHGWSDSDMQAMDNLDAYIARHRANQAARAELAKPTLAPAWHDAPTCDGLWMCNEGDDNPYRWTTHRVTFPLNQLLVGEDERWYGPIQQEGDKP